MKADNMEWKCEFCGTTFVYKRNLTRHVKMKHSSSSISFECIECGKSFSTKFSLRQHEASHDKSSLFECHHCGKRLKLRNSVLRHIKAQHASVIEPTSTKKSFVCHRCGMQLSRKESLIKHIEARHLSHRQIFECFHCSLKCEKKRHLIEHINSCHMAKKSKIKCLKCDTTYTSSRDLRKHYTETHNIALKFENREFDSYEKFEEWLQNMERQTITHFVKRDRYATSSKTTLRLICHRSGTYRGQQEEDQRKRCLKTTGYKRLGGFCPAEIKVTFGDRMPCSMNYQTTHVGHNIEDTAELKYIYTNKVEKLRIAAKIQSGVPLPAILKQERSSDSSTKNINRLSLLNQKDVRNIATTFNISLENRGRTRLNYDAIDVNFENMIAEHWEDVLYRKSQTEEDVTSGLFGKEDFILIIMTENQEKCLRRYGHNVVAMDGIRCADDDELILHTLCVADVDGEGLPVAFLLTNRHDQDVVEFFLTCIYNRVGAVKPQILVTDTQMMYCTSFVNVMSAPDYYFFSLWHVRETWKKILRKIANKEKREAVRKELNGLVEESHPIAFEERLNTFLSSDDEDLSSFLEYFGEMFAKNASLWACCYRQFPGLNTKNMNVEVFHREFKRHINDGKTRSVSECLAFIFQYLDFTESRILEKEIRGKITFKLAELRKRHRAALECSMDSTRVVTIDDYTFLVASCKNVASESCDDTFTISKNESKQCAASHDDDIRCRLFCISCKICVHEFTCNCVDSSVKHNMCTHIHILGLYLKNRKSEVGDTKCGVRKRENSVERVDIANSDLKNSISYELDYEIDEHTRRWFDKMQRQIRVLAVGSDDIVRATPEELEHIYANIFTRIQPTLLEYRSKTQHNIEPEY